MASNCFLKVFTLKTLVFFSASFLAASCAKQQDSSDILGVEDGNTRPGASAIQIQFNSIGNGIDSVAQEALEKFLAYEKGQGRLLMMKQKTWGREGETNYCAQFDSAQSRALAANTISRLTWTSMNTGRSTYFNVTTECGEDALKPFSNTQLGAFVQNSAESTLTCTSTLRPEDGYTAKLSLNETIGNDGKTVAIKMSLAQASRNARFGLIEEMVTETAISVDNIRMFTVNYLSESLKLELWPAVIDPNQYHANLTVEGDLLSLLTCVNN